MDTKKVIEKVISDLNKSAEETWANEKITHVGKVNLVDSSTIAIDLGVGKLDTEWCTVVINEEENGLVWEISESSLFSKKSENILEVIMQYSILPALEEIWAHVPLEFEKIRIGKRIKFIREKNGISQGRLAKLTGLKRPNITRIECGKYTTGLLVLSKIAAALNCNLDFVGNERNGESDNN